MVDQFAPTKVLALVVVLLSSYPLAGQVTLLPAGSSVGGLTLEEWSAEGWKWQLGLMTNVSPIMGIATGVYAVQIAAMGEGLKKELSPPVQGQFATTHWSVVLAAGDSSSARASEALARLCRGYWYPLYFYVRRLGHGPADAQDLTQEFFSRVLEKRYLSAADPEKGRFRSFLLTAPTSLEMTEGALRVAVCRLRQRYRELLRAEIESKCVSRFERRSGAGHRRRCRRRARPGA